MTKRSVVAVLILPFVTFGIYALYWLVKSKREMVARGASIPTSWLLLVPIAGIYWHWKFAEGVEYVSRGKLQGIAVFLLMFVFPIIGIAVVQSTFNSVSDMPAQPSLPYARVM